MSSVERAKQIDPVAGESGGKIQLVLPDGTVKEVPSGTTGLASQRTRSP